MRGFEIISDAQMMQDFGEVVEVKMPMRGTKKSAGYDIFSPYTFTLEPGQSIVIPTGLKVYMNDGEFLMIVPRSGLGFKYYTRLANTCGIIDSDFYDNPKNEGHFMVKIRNEGYDTFTVEKGEAFCQAIFVPFLLADGDSFENGDDRIGGFGSTSK